MPIKIPCVSCGRTLSAPDSAAGKRARCPSCGTVQQLPAAAEPDVLEPEAVPEPGAYAPPPPPPPPVDDDPFASLGEPYGVVEDAPPVAKVAGGGGGGGEQRRPCPMCGEMIAMTAMKCRFCNSIFDPTLRKAEAKRSRNYAAGDDDMTGAEWVVALICSGIGCILGVVWMIQGKPKGKKMFLVSLGAGLFWSAVRAMIESSSRR
jgi:predicted RNA-binding Zn-ribbon protein involved in translation (DUF1610 family)